MALSFDEYGSRENPTLLLLPGAGVLDTFCRQYGLAMRYHLVVPHLPGAGRAARIPYEPEATVQALCRLMERLGREKVGLLGHSLGGQVAVRLVCECPERIGAAAFLSVWAEPDPRILRLYSGLGGLAAPMMRWKGLVRLQAAYWHFPADRAQAMVDSAAQTTPEVWRSFFAHPLRLSELPAYESVGVPMLAACGNRETRGIRESLALLGRNPHCHTDVIAGAGHDFPMRHPEKLNPMLEAFFSKHL